MAAIGPAALRRLCLGFPGAVEEFPFNEETSVFKVGGRIFAWSALGARPLEVVVKCEPALAEQHRDAWPEAVRPAPYLGAKGWNAVRTAGPLPAAHVRDMVEDSYDLVAARLPAGVRRGLGGPAGRPARLRRR